MIRSCYRLKTRDFDRSLQLRGVNYQWLEGPLRLTLQRQCPVRTVLSRPRSRKKCIRPRWPAIDGQGALRVAPYSITQTNRITHFESNSPKRNKTRKDARHCKLAEEGFIPRTLTVKTKLSFTDRLKKGPETCKQLQD